MESPKLAVEHPYPPSISSRGSFSSDDTGTYGRPRHNTLPSPLPSSLSIEVPAQGNVERASLEHPLKYLGAGRFFRPGSEDHSGWRRIRERASWTKSSPRLSDNRSMWPSPSQRDLLKEAGDWLDAHFPVPDAPTPATEWELPSSPLREGQRASSLLSSSRPSFTTTREEVDGADGKIVYNERENKLKELIDKMQQDFDAGRDAKPSREARVRQCLKELQAQNEYRASITNQSNQGPVELDASLTSLPTESPMEKRKLDFPGPEDEFPYESAKDSLLLCASLENERVFQPLPAIDLTRAFDDDFSAATARALNDLPSPSIPDSGLDTEAAQTPTPVAPSERQPDYFVTGSSSRVSPPIRPSTPQSEKPEVLQPSPVNRDSTASVNSSQAFSDAFSSSTPGSSDVANEQREVSIESTPHLETSPTRSVFSDLEKLVRASEIRHSEIIKTH